MLIASRYIAGAGLFLLAVANGVFAQTTTQDRLDSDERVRRQLSLALDDIHRASCENRQPCAPATPEERANPPIAISEARLVMQRSVLSGISGHCGLDWQRRNYLPLMAYYRTAQRKTERQMALIALLHGNVMEQARQAFSARGPCTEQTRQNLESQLTFAQ